MPWEMSGLINTMEPTACFGFSGPSGPDPDQGRVDDQGSGTMIDFDDYSVTSFANQDVKPISVTKEDEGRTLHMVGNTWKKIPLAYPITTSTVLEFDFKSTAQGEVHAIALETDNTTTDSYFFKLYGTDSFGVGDYNNYASSAPNWKHYVITVGQYYQFTSAYLVFATDHDVTSPTAVSYFSNVRIYNGPGRVVHQFDGEGEQIADITYNAGGTTTILDALGNETTHAYDERRTLVTSTDDQDGDTSKTYGPHFRPEDIIDESGNPTHLAWSSDAVNLTEIVDAESNQTDMDYDFAEQLDHTYRRPAQRHDLRLQ